MSSKPWWTVSTRWSCYSWQSAYGNWSGCRCLVRISCCWPRRSVCLKRTPAVKSIATRHCTQVWFMCCRGRSPGTRQEGWSRWWTASVIRLCVKSRKTGSCTSSCRGFMNPARSVCALSSYCRSLTCAVTIGLRTRWCTGLSWQSICRTWSVSDRICACCSFISRESSSIQRAWYCPHPCSATFISRLTRCRIMTLRKSSESNEFAFLEDASS